MVGEPPVCHMSHHLILPNPDLNSVALLQVEKQDLSKVLAKPNTGRSYRNKNTVADQIPNFLLLLKN
jgi:hypothetical protein